MPNTRSNKAQEPEKEDIPEETKENGTATSSEEKKTPKKRALKEENQKKKSTAKKPKVEKKVKKATSNEHFGRDPIERIAVPEGKASTKVISWNVNGLRAIVKNNKEKLLNLVTEEQPDILCLQETKLQEKHTKDVQHLIPGYKSYWTCSTKKLGYSGSGVFVKKEHKDVAVTFGINDKAHLGEGRAITVEMNDYFLVALYVPNSGQKLDRLDYRTKEWDIALRKYVKELEAKGKPVVVTGDLNVAHLDLDIYNYDAKHIAKTAGCTKQERDSFSEWLEDGYVDSLRHLHPEAKGAFTYWSTRAGNRQWNKGLRLDYFVCSKSMVDEKLHESYILDKITEGASDHAPIGAVFLSTATE